MSTASASSSRPPDSQPRTRPPATRPSCTHVHMERVYGRNLTCQICHRVPSFGFVYYCQQDNDRTIAKLAPLKVPVPPKSRSKKLQKAPNEAQTPPWSVAFQLEMLGFNSSVVKAAEAGHYTREQIAILKAQKLRVKAVIKAAMETHEVLKSKHGLEPKIDAMMEVLEMLKPNAGPSPAVLAEKLADIGNRYPAAQETRQEPGEREHTLNTSRNDKGKSKIPKPKSKSKSKSRSITKPAQRCEFRVCQTCRPTSRDRNFISFEAVFAEQIHPPKIWKPEYMPVHPASLMRNIGTRQPMERFVIEVEESDMDSDSSWEDLDHNMNAGLGIAGLQHPAERRMPGTLPDFRPRAAASTISTLLVSPARSETEVEKLHVQHSSANFRATLAKDLRRMIERDAAALSRQESLTGFDTEVLEELNKLYFEEHGDVFDLALWKNMAARVLETAAYTALPGEDGEDGLEQEEEPVTNGQNGNRWVHDQEVHVKGGVAVTEEGIEHESPDIISSV